MIIKSNINNTNEISIQHGRDEMFPHIDQITKAGDVQYPRLI